MYRAHPIEGTDTVFVKATLEDGPEVRLAMSHACDGTAYDLECVECERAVILRRSEVSPERQWQRTLTVTHADGRVEEMTPLAGSHLKANLRHYFAYLRGEADRPLTRLEDTRPFVALHALSYLAAGRITSVLATSLTVRDTSGERPERFIAIDGLAEVATRFVESGALPSAQGIPWAKCGGCATPADLPEYRKKMNALVEHAAACGARLIYMHTFPREGEPCMGP